VTADAPLFKRNITGTPLASANPGITNTTAIANAVQRRNNPFTRNPPHALKNGLTAFTGP
jgi:hypothetical protein